MKIDNRKLDLLLAKRCMNLRDLRVTGTSPQTLTRIRRGEDVLPATLGRIASFSFGGETIHETGYRINPEKCIGCQDCHSVCPQGCISSTVPRAINASRCIHCGNCFRTCPVKAVEKLG